MTYNPNPISTEGIELPTELVALQDRLAENAHEIWAKKRISEGWRWGKHRNDDTKEHPNLVPYHELPKSEREYDRAVINETIKAIIVLGYQIKRPL